MPGNDSLPDDLAIIPANPQLGIPGGFAQGGFLDGRIWTVLDDGAVIQSNLGTFTPYTGTGIYPASYNAALQGLNPITYRKSNDRLYASGFDPYNLYVIDWRGSIPQPVPLLPFLPEGRGLNGFQFGPDELYSPDAIHGQILQIDADSGIVTPIVSNILTPIAVKVDSKGNVYFNDRGTGYVYKYNPQTHQTNILAKLRPALDNLVISLDEKSLYVTNNENEIIKVNADTGINKTLYTAPFQQVWDLKFDPDTNSIFVADFSSVKQFNANNGKLKRESNFSAISSGVASTGSTASSINVESGPNAKIVVTDVTLGNVVVLNKADLSPYDTTLTSNNTNLAFKQPMSGVHVNDPVKEYYLVTNTVDGTIVKISHNGDINSNNIVTQTVVTGLNAPVKLQINNDFLYIVELGQAYLGIPKTGRISRIPLSALQASSVMTNQLSNPQVLVDNLDNPNGLDIINGKMYFVEAGRKRLLKADATTPGNPTVVENGLKLQQDIIVSQFNPVAQINPPSAVTMRLGYNGLKAYINETKPNAIASFSDCD